MLLINEWLPNPKGSDTSGEWIELYNSGPETISLGGYGIASSKSKPYIFGTQTLLPNQYLLLPRTASKISLRNQDESLTLTDPHGAVIDTSKFVGTAEEAKSFSRVSEKESNSQQQFIFTEPTPGMPNKIPVAHAAASPENNYPFGVPLRAGISGFEWTIAAILVGIGLTLAITTIIGRNAALSELFFR